MGVIFRLEQLLHNMIFSIKIANVYVSSAVVIAKDILSNCQTQALEF